VSISEQQPEPSGAVDEAATTPGPRVLIVDDEPTIRQILRIGLESEGFATSMAANAQEGIDLVRADPPALVILDLMMPQRDGWWFLRELQGCAHPRPVVLVLSARSGQGERLLAHHLGVAEYLVKPFDLDEVVRKVRHKVGASSSSTSTST
jgi:DNA-binding response OmpR family regulator